MARVRLDTELVQQGFFTSTSDALRAIMAGEVSTTNRKLTSAGEQVKPGIE
ncbi:MAG: S4 domain-containing protein, partial [Atopobium minutum]|nr:S4 domain-containing protein [Atopobium minutum]